MREIKFRAWDVRLKKMHKVVSLNFYDGWCYCENNFIERFNLKFSPSNQVEQECIVMQYTGPKDKNGKEIYEGDILIDEIERIFVIISMLGGLSVLPVKYYHDKIGNELIAQPTNDSQVYSALCNFKIIGNIYQNPELLEKP